MTVTRSTRQRWRSIGSVAIAATTGPGSATPLVSITTRSMSTPPSQSDTTWRRTRTSSSRRSQHTQPPAITWMELPVPSAMRWSSGTSPNSFTITAARSPAAPA